MVEAISNGVFFEGDQDREVDVSEVTALFYDVLDDKETQWPITLGDLLDWAEDEAFCMAVRLSLSADADTSRDVKICRSVLVAALKSLGMDFEVERQRIAHHIALKKQKEGYQAGVLSCGDDPKYENARRYYELCVRKCELAIQRLGVTS